MTRTEKLQLCTWLPEDPVSLDEMNENFQTLDTAGTWALNDGEAALCTLAGLMRERAKAGSDISFAERMHYDAFPDPTTIESIEGLVALGGIHVDSAGLSEQLLFSTASGASLGTCENNVETELCTFYAEGHGTLSNIKITCKQNGTYKDGDIMILRLYDGESVISSTQKNMASTATSSNYNFIMSTASLAPNHLYRLTLQVAASLNNRNVGSIQDITLYATAAPTTEGTAVTKPISLAPLCYKLRLMLGAPASAPALQISYDGEAWQDLQVQESRAANGESIYFYTCAANGAQSCRLKIALGNGCTEISNLMLVML